MSAKLADKNVAVLMSNGFEQIEFTDPCAELRQAGATVTVVSPDGGEIKGWQKDRWGDVFSADLRIEQARAEDFDALLLPGGVMNPDNVRSNRACVEFVSSF